MENTVQKQISKSPWELRKRARIYTQSLLAGESRSQALRNAGYAESVARNGQCALLQNPAHLKPFIQSLENKGVSDDFLAEKVRTLLDAHETIFFQKDGVVKGERSVPVWETQRKSAELALKLKGHLKEQSQLDVNIGLMAMVVSAVKGDEDPDAIDV